EIPNYVPAIPGVTQVFDLNSLVGVGSETAAADPSTVHGELQGVVEALRGRLTAVVAGDAATAQAVAADATMPEAVRQFAAEAPSLTPVEREARLPQVMGALETYLTDLGRQFEHGIKQGFAVSIRLLFQVSFVILLLGSAVIPFIPGLPLRKVAAMDVARGAAKAD
ncbi:MAG TPA: hypothetical protein PLU66_11355, partial [Trueperaceae bacterium]|nr:hypothetical protein [Trueperaceae bacterium]